MTRHAHHSGSATSILRSVSYSRASSICNKPSVTWDMVTKIDFRDGQISSIKMFLDPAPIEEAYPAPG